MFITSDHLSCLSFSLPFSSSSWALFGYRSSLLTGTHPNFCSLPGFTTPPPPTVSVVLIINFITFMLSAPQVHATRYLFCVSDDISLVRSDKRRGSHRIIAGQFMVSATAAPGPGSPYLSRNRRSQPSTRHDAKALFRYHAPVHQSGIRVSSYLSQSLGLSNITFINCYFISN